MESKDEQNIIPHILLVDDDEKNLLALETLLQDLNVELTKCTSGKKALELFMQNEYALVLLDVQMPEMDGFETARLIRSNHHFSRIPIIFVTAINKEDRHIHKGLEAGAIDYLFKPIDPVVLLSKVNILLDYYIQNKKMKFLVERLNESQKLLIESNNKLNTLAHQDTVTGLSNRLDFSEFLEIQLEQAKRNNHKLALLFIDLDNFKHVNDNYGHEAGDNLLKEVAERLKISIRKSDALIARLGGDEFSVILPDIAEDKNAFYIAKRILKEINSPFKIDGNIEVLISASIGISTYPFAGDSIQALCRNADLAMYEAKSRGKNTYCTFSNELNTRHNKVLMIEKGIREALQEKLFYLVYQPIIDLKSLKPVGVEALCRCHLKMIEEISQEEFIRVAEDAGLISQLGEWILETAITESKKYLFPLNNELYTHIKLSERQLQHPGFLTFLQGIHKKSQIESSKIIFELTESPIMFNTKLISACMEKN